MPETAAPLEIVYVDISLLDPNPWNPNVQDESTAQAERESIEEHGFIDPVTVRRHPTVEGRFQIIDGEHRTQEAVALGHTEAPVVVLDVDEDTAKRLTMILNETRGDHDVAKLGALLADLAERFDLDALLIGLPYSSGELEHLLEIGRFDGWDDLDAQAMGRRDANSEKPPSVTYTFPTQRDANRFSRLVTKLSQRWECDDVTAITRAMQRAASDP